MGRDEGDPRGDHVVWRGIEEDPRLVAKLQHADHRRGELGVHVDDHQIQHDQDRRSGDDDLARLAEPVEDAAPSRRADRQILRHDLRPLDARFLLRDQRCGVQNLRLGRRQRGARRGQPVRRVVEGRIGGVTVPEQPFDPTEGRLGDGQGAFRLPDPGLGGPARVIAAFASMSSACASRSPTVAATATASITSPLSTTPSSGSRRISSPRRRSAPRSVPSCWRCPRRRRSFEAFQAAYGVEIAPRPGEGRPSQ